MAGGVRIPRSRGGLSGLLIFLLGAWGGVAPFVGPSFGYGFGPDRAWAYTPGRLYLSAIPGVVTALAGLVVLATRSRWFGGSCAFLAALGGAWFIAGASVVTLLPASLTISSVTQGTVLGGPSRDAVTGLGFFTGVGAAIIFLAALSLGRFSVAAFKDHVRAADLAGGVIYESGDDEVTYQPGPAPYVQVPSQHPSQYPPEHEAPAGQFLQTEDTFPATHPYPPGPGMYTAAQSDSA
jgi:hypothetical protein